MIRIAESGPTRKVIAIDIKKRKAAAKLRKHTQHEQNALYAGTSAPDTHDGTDAKAETEMGTASEPDGLYEDVSAEVEARLKAKEIQRKVKKGSMKRKRSSDSLVGAWGDVGINVISGSAFKRQRSGVNVNIYIEDSAGEGSLD